MKARTGALKTGTGIIAALGGRSGVSSGVSMGVALIGALLSVGCAGCDARSGTAQQGAKEAKVITTTAATGDGTRKEVGDMGDVQSKGPRRPATIEGVAEVKPLEMTEEQWKAKLSKDEYYVLRQRGTERAFTGEYWRTKPAAEQAKDMAVYKCRACGLELFRGDSKFDSGCGWPSFDRMIKRGTVKEVLDTSHGMVRTEVVCERCSGHLGHLFDDGPTETGLRYCINSVSIVREVVPGQKAAAPKVEEKK